MMNKVEQIAVKKQGNIAVLFGGESSERDVSLMSGQCVLAAFERLNIAVIAIDVVLADLKQVLLEHKIKHAFIILHGGDGENGTVQALLEILGISYTGSQLLGCA